MFERPVNLQEAVSLGKDFDVIQVQGRLFHGSLDAKRREWNPASFETRQ